MIKSVPLTTENAVLLHQSTIFQGARLLILLKVPLGMRISAVLFIPYSRVSNINNVKSNGISISKGIKNPCKTAKRSF